MLLLLRYLLFVLSFHNLQQNMQDYNIALKDKLSWHRFDVTGDHGLNINALNPTVANPLHLDK